LLTPTGIPDGYAIKTNETFKNTVETDQETSFVQAIYKYVQKSGFCRHFHLLKESNRRHFHPAREREWTDSSSENRTSIELSAEV
jgi:hypothetical protein